MTKYIKTPREGFLYAVMLSLLMLVTISAADAPKQPTGSTASRDLPTVESLTVELTAAKARIAELEDAVKQLNTASALLQAQRNAAMDAEVQRAMSAVAAKK